MNKIFLLSLITFVSISFSSYGQNKDEETPLGENPIYFIDSVRVARIDNLNPNDLASVTVYKNKEATDIIGEDGKDGLIYMETKTFARRRYWRYFMSKSPEYAKIVPTPETDTVVQYILNNKIRTEKQGLIGNLASINDKTFKNIQIIGKATLIKDYGIENKEYGVIISSDIPSNLLGGKDKF